jgi:hypothetical protein
METSIRDTRRAPVGPDRFSPAATARREPKTPARNPRSDRVALGFWLGGLALGTAGGVLGVCMPYHHPVAVVISALWWGVYLGCFGGSVGGLIAWFTERAAAAPSRESGGAAAPPGGADSRAFPAGARGIITAVQAGSRTFGDGVRA